MAAADLLPCPKCASTNLERDTQLGPFPIPAVLCIDCGWGEPAERWNERAPVPMLLCCPHCHTPHVDAPEPENGWTNPPHKSHLCHACGAIWRPASVPTVGVERVPAGEHDRAPREVTP